MKLTALLQNEGKKTFEMKTEKAQDGAVFDSIRNDIQKNNVKEMSLDEINGEINEARKNLRNN